MAKIRNFDSFGGCVPTFSPDKREIWHGERTAVSNFTFIGAQDLCVPVSTVSTRSALRSAARGDLVIPRTRRRLRNRAFSVAGPAAWNSLPPDIRTASTLCSFKNLLKTHLFFHSFQLST